MSSASSSRFVISPPTTTDDDGAPSESCSRDVERILRMVEDERHLSALKLLRNVQERLAPTSHVVEPKPKHHGLRLRKSRSTVVLQEKLLDHRDAQELLGKSEEMLFDLEVSRLYIEFFILFFW
jgi:hypothetical protein